VIVWELRVEASTPLGPDPLFPGDFFLGSTFAGEEISVHRFHDGPPLPVYGDIVKRSGLFDPDWLSAVVESKLLTDRLGDNPPKEIQTEERL
jgi:hypothetical protein